MPRTPFLTALNVVLRYDDVEAMLRQIRTTIADARTAQRRGSLRSSRVGLLDVLCGKPRIDDVIRKLGKIRK